MNNSRSSSFASKKYTEKRERTIRCHMFDVLHVNFILSDDKTRVWSRISTEGVYDLIKSSDAEITMKCQIVVEPSVHNTALFRESFNRKLLKEI